MCGARGPPLPLGEPSQLVAGQGRRGGRLIGARKPAVPRLQEAAVQLGRQHRVEQRVLTPLGTLHLNAAASVRAETPCRVDFAFDEGYFEFRQGGLPRVPYPVPFRLLGKEAEGYLDTTYLSERVRVSTGNKGTQFVLTREPARLIGSESSSS